MGKSHKKINRIIGVDMHPDVFSAAFIRAQNATDMKVEKVQDRLPTQQLEQWAQKNLSKEDVLVMEASGNSFEVCAKLHALGYTALVLESYQASKVKENYCNDDKHSAIKLARVYLSGLAKIVWQPDEKVRRLRDILFTYRSTVKDTTRARNRIRSFLSDHMVRLTKGTRLTAPSTLNKVLKRRDWDPQQALMLKLYFEKLWHAEGHRKELNKLMSDYVLKTPALRGLLSLMGIRHIAAFAIGAIIGDVNRFPTAKKLVGYIGLAPGKSQSGNNKKGYNTGIGNGGRRDLRGILLNSAQNALSQKKSPYHTWGWKLQIKKNRNIAAAAVARKIVMSIWHLMKGNFTPMKESNEHLRVKVGKLATLIGVKEIKKRGYPSKTKYVEKMIELILFHSTLPINHGALPQTPLLIAGEARDNK